MDCQASKVRKGFKASAACKVSAAWPVHRASQVSVAQLARPVQPVQLVRKGCRVNAVSKASAA